ncbi:uncharacterized protein LOC141660649 [Apium graveolens]|uniref:uncharacterized protein LOC141660649 n=1 Tax=Apium graveolens TaxID=4045 RepID=UPI003D79D14C
MFVGWGEAIIEASEEQIIALSDHQEGGIWPFSESKEHAKVYILSDGLGAIWLVDVPDMFNGVNFYTASVLNRSRFCRASCFCVTIYGSITNVVHFLCNFPFREQLQSTKTGYLPTLILARCIYVVPFAMMGMAKLEGYDFTSALLLVRISNMGLGFHGCIVISDEMLCPCKNCRNGKWHTQDLIYDHLICHGPCPLYANWICEVSSKDHRIDIERAENMGFEDSFTFGNNLDEMFHRTNDNTGPNDDAKKFYGHLVEGKQPLYPGCKKFSRLSFIIRLYSLKCIHGISESGFGDLLELIKDAFPEAHIPLSFNAAKNVIKDLGLDYQRIHACPNNCMLFWAENEKEENCKTCGASRWVVVEKKGAVDNNEKKLIHKVPANVMRYFPLKTRLQCMFMSKELSELMLWHAKGRRKDGKLRHPADAEAWKALDARYPQFSSENRNIRLGLAADGFNPFRTMNISHSTWPIILVNYNLPPWLCMKQENLILSTLISGPESRKNNIDVFMQPLIAELNELWEVGIETYDALTDHTFNLHASLLWIISDFPGLAMLSGWSTKGRLVCPVCNYETSSMYLKHSRKMCYMDHRRFLHPEHPWRLDKRKFNGQIELRGFPEVLTGTDIEELLAGFVNHFGGKKPEKKRKRQKNKIKSNSPFKKKSIFFDLPYWKHNVSRHNLDVIHIEKNVCDKVLGTLLNIAGKTKDHIAARLDLQEFGIRKVLHPILSSDGKHLEIRAAIFDMTNEEKDLFCSVLKNAKLTYGSASNISRCVHMKERKVSGYKSHDAHFFMHYLLQFTVKKSLKPEVAVPFIRLGAFLRGIWSKVIDLRDLKRLQTEIIEIICQFETIFIQAFFDVMVHLLIHLCQEIEFGGPAHVRKKVEFPIGSRRNKDGKAVNLVEVEWMAIHRYILFNCGNKEIDSLIKEHRILIEGQAKSKRYNREREHSEDFWKWMKGEVGKKDNISKELEVLAMGPNQLAKKYSGYVLNGYRFHTKYRDAKCTTQNSGVFLTALTTSFASSKDQNPLFGDVNYYGAIEEIFEVDYWGEFSVVVFKCCWYKEEKDLYGLTRVNFNRLCQKSDPYVLASQVQQVFYVEDPTEKMMYNVIKKLPRDWCDVEAENANEEAEDPVLHDLHTSVPLETDTDINWCRDDVPTRQVPIKARTNEETT